MVSDSERQQFQTLFDRVFEEDGNTVRNCTRYPCIDLMLFCDIIAPHEIPEEELPPHKIGEDPAEWEKQRKVLSYYGNLESGVMKIDRIHELHLKLKNGSI